MFLLETSILVKKKYTLPGLAIKKILGSPFGDQLEKYSRQMQIFTRQFVYL